MNNLIIGNTSQLSHLFPSEYDKISSRNINFDDSNYDSVYITFAEQRTFDTNLKESDFIDVNVKYTSKVIEHFSKLSKRVIVYGTAELWNAHDGGIEIETEIKYKYSPYIKSKEILWEIIKSKRDKNEWKNVNIIHPFNFNSLNRKSGFLFFKLFDALINDKITKVGNINIERDIIHVKYLIEESINCNNDIIVGSGKLTNIRDFIMDIFKYYNKNFSNYIIEEDIKSQHQDNNFWLKKDKIYKNLFLDTIQEINGYYERN